MRTEYARDTLRRAVWLALAALAVTMAAHTTALAAEPYAPGERIDRLVLEDQHGVERAVDESVALVLFARDMNAGDVAKVGLADVDGETLAGRRAVYVADISGMPGLVARMFALPKMRKRTYPMLLDRDGKATARFPAREGIVTLMRLDALGLQAVEYVGDAAALAAALGLKRPGTGQAPAGTPADAPR